MQLIITLRIWILAWKFESVLVYTLWPALWGCEGWYHVVSLNTVIRFSRGEPVYGTPRSWWNSTMLIHDRVLWSWLARQCPWGRLVPCQHSLCNLCGLCLTATAFKASLALPPAGWDVEPFELKIRIICKKKSDSFIEKLRQVQKIWYLRQV